MDKSIVSIFGGAFFLLISSLILLWRKVEMKVNWKTCSEKHDHQTKLNIEVIERLAKVETKLDIGFERISRKIENGGKK